MAMNLLTAPFKFGQICSPGVRSESLDRICQCVDHLNRLARYEYRLSLGETMRFEGAGWSNGADIKALLEQAKDRDPLVWGDIYARRVQ